MFRLINNLKNKKGFTLIELIVVLAVLAIIMAIAVPRFLGVQENAKVKADNSTKEQVAKAAELYYYATNSTSFTIKSLIDNGYMEPFTLQADSNYDTAAEVEAVDITVSVTSTSQSISVDW
ncbi:MULTISPECIES: competence type IV pilus major pilin ComGC [unclassified Sedimentibacter]|uniref:competence type IV pilus major pilin ComGC n=1 Tax=unclassified Sedimentibacter TaxID=2649220 RepID=UPI0027E156FA|nr:type II secretion system protein [Sedimentibacter sp. MB35-C1]WMJ76674.1 type II secretion system protein [Sedimentibacter sp. MB35-C1]